VSMAPIPKPPVRLSTFHRRNGKALDQAERSLEAVAPHLGSQRRSVQATADGKGLRRPGFRLLGLLVRGLLITC
jgi:hypothetical protein